MFLKEPIYHRNTCQVLDQLITESIMKISVIGAGAMGGATVEGMIKADYFDNKDALIEDI